MAKETRVLVVVGGVPHASVGASLVLYHAYIDGLRRAGFDVLNLMLLQPDNSSEERLAQYRREMGEGPGFRILTCTSPRFVKTNRWGHRFDHAAVEPLRAEVEAFRPQVTVCLDFPSAWAVDGWAVGRRVAWLGDLYFQNFLHHALYGRREGETSLYHLWMARLHSRQWKRLYARVLKPFADLIASARSSEPALAELGLKAVYRPFPWPGEPLRATGETPPAKPTFFFFGQLQGLGSRSAFHTMAVDVYPKLREHWGPEGFEILIGGRGGLPPWAQADIAGKPEFTYLGFVEDLDPVMARCHALLFPIDVPIGNRSRILTALAKGMLVVAHANTALGNPDLVDGETCLLAATPEEFVDRLSLAVERPAEAAAIAERGLAMYKHRFALDAAVPVLVDIVRSEAALAA